MAPRGRGAVRDEGSRQSEGPTIQPVEKAQSSGSHPSQPVTSNNKIIFLATSYL